MNDNVTNTRKQSNSTKHFQSEMNCIPDNINKTNTHTHKFLGILWKMRHNIDIDAGI